jgi:hypothetical protein
MQSAMHSAPGILRGLLKLTYILFLIYTISLLHESAIRFVVFILTVSVCQPLSRKKKTALP